MSDPHLGGDLLIQTAGEEHNHTALAKKVVLQLLNLAATAYGSPSLLEGTDGNAMMVGLADPTTGAPLEIKNPSCLADGALSITVTAVYTAAEKAWLTKIHARNSGASTRVVTFAFRASSSGTTRGIWPAITLLTGESFDLLAEEGVLGLTAGNQILASQNAGTDVDYLISGEELT